MAKGGEKLKPFLDIFVAYIKINRVSIELFKEQTEQDAAGRVLIPGAGSDKSCSTSSLTCLDAAAVDFLRFVGPT